MPRLIAPALLLALTIGASITNRAAVADDSDGDRVAKTAAEVVKRTQKALTVMHGLEAEKKRGLEVVRKARVRPGQNVARYARGNRNVPIALIYGSQEEKAKFVAQWEESLAAMQAEIKRVSERDFYFGFLSDNPGIGDFGELRGVEVLQVVGPQRMLVMLGNDVLDRPTLLVEGVSTEGAVDGQTYNIETVVQVTGTYSYTNTLGAKRTVLKAQPMETAPIKAYIQEHKLMEQ